MDLYESFYRSILQLSDQVVIAPFSEVTTDFGGVIRRCNETFGSTFRYFEPTQEAEEAVAQMIDAEAAQDFQPNDVHRVVGRPSPQRRGGEDLLDHLNDRLREKLRTLDDLYAEVLKAGKVRS